MKHHPSGFLEPSAYQCGFREKADQHADGGPFIAAFALGTLGEWRYIFPIFAGITLVSMLWLMFTEVP